MFEQAKRKQPDFERVLGDLSTFLSDAGFAIEQQFGDWERQPLTEASPEIITIAAPA